MIDLDMIRAARERLAEAERAAYRPKPGADQIGAVVALADAERALINAVMGRAA